MRPPFSPRGILGFWLSCGFIRLHFRLPPRPHSPFSLGHPGTMPSNLHFGCALGFHGFLLSRWCFVLKHIEPHVCVSFRPPSAPGSSSSHVIWNEVSVRLGCRYAQSHRELFCNTSSLCNESYSAPGLPSGTLPRTPGSLFCYCFFGVVTCRIAYDLGVRTQSWNSFISTIAHLPACHSASSTPLSSPWPSQRHSISHFVLVSCGMPCSHHLTSSDHASLTHRFQRLPYASDHQTHFSGHPFSWLAHSEQKLQRTCCSQGRWFHSRNDNAYSSQDVS